MLLEIENNALKYNIRLQSKDMSVGKRNFCLGVKIENWKYHLAQWRNSAEILTGNMTQNRDPFYEKNLIRYFYKKHIKRHEDI